MSFLSDPRWNDALTRLPDYLGSHVRVSLAAIALGLAVSFPLALMVRRKPVLRDLALGIASVVQTVPGLALLALFYPLLLALAGLSLQWFGYGFSAFGFLPSVLALARTVLSLGAQGEVILLGRGAGSILPARSTLHVRLVAPLADRIAYMSQWMRLTVEEAAEQVRQRDAQRGEFLATHFHRTGADLYQYDLILNTSRLGEERCAEMIIQAAKIKLGAMAK